LTVTARTALAMAKNFLENITAWIDEGEEG
jgi:hypothetical protein